MKKQKLYITGSVLIGLGALSAALIQQPAPATSLATASPDAVCYAPGGSPWNFAESGLLVGSQEVFVAVADTPRERQAGLGGCASLPSGAGMYFPFNSPTSTSFWMKGMVMPIDMIWIADGLVVGIESNVAPQPGVPDARLARYSATQPITAVLEVGAGQAAQLGITVGDRVVKR